MTQTQSKTPKQAWDALSLELQRLRKICESIDLMATKRAISELRELCPDLPNNGEAFHLAHNWLVCGKDKDKSRKARFIINRHSFVSSKAYKLKDSYYLKKARQIQKMY